MYLDPMLLSSSKAEKSLFINVVGIDEFGSMISWTTKEKTTLNENEP